jgi:hypothetical protein
MSRDSVRVERRAAEIGRFVPEVERFAMKALEKAAEVVRFKVMDLTPRWKGGLVQKVKRRAERSGRSQLVYGEGLVFRVHERNAQWSRMPPHAPLRAWVVGKLGVSEDDADSVAFRVRRKIKARGLTLPNREGRGRMIQRTKDLMRRTRFHFQAFGSAMKSMIRRR